MRDRADDGVFRLAAVSARLELVPLGRSDAEAVRALTDDPLITASVSFLRYPFGLDEALQLISANASGRDCFCGAWIRADHQLIGVVGAHLQPACDVEIGYWIGSAFQSQGFATEAAAALIAVLRHDRPDLRIVAECRPDNRASWRVLERLGFQALDEPGARPGRVRLAWQTRCDLPGTRMGHR